MDIRIELNTIWIQDKAISVNKDGLCCLSELVAVLRGCGLYERPISSVMQRKGVRKDISFLIGEDLTGRRNPIRILKERGVYVTSGRRSQSRIYCRFDIFIMILWHYSDKTRQLLIKGIFNDNIKQ